MSSKTLDKLIAKFLAQGLTIPRAKEAVKKVFAKTPVSFYLDFKGKSLDGILIGDEADNTGTMWAGSRRYLVKYDNEFLEVLYIRPDDIYGVAINRSSKPTPLAHDIDTYLSLAATSASVPSSAPLVSAASSASSASSSGLDIRTLVPGEAYDVTQKNGRTQSLRFINVKDDRVCFAHSIYCIGKSEITQITTPVPLAGTAGAAESTSGGRKRRSTHRKRTRRHTRR